MSSDGVPTTLKLAREAMPDHVVPLNVARCIVDGAAPGNYLVRVVYYAVCPGGGGSAVRRSPAYSKNRPSKSVSSTLPSGLSVNVRT